MHKKDELHYTDRLSDWWTHERTTPPSWVGALLKLATAQWSPILFLLPSILVFTGTVSWRQTNVGLSGIANAYCSILHRMRMRAEN